MTKNAFHHDIHAFRGVAITLIVGTQIISALDWSVNHLTMHIIDALCNESSIFFFLIEKAIYLFPVYALGMAFSHYRHGQRLWRSSSGCRGC